MLAALNVAFEIAWDPGLRGIAVVAVGVTVLCGSVYLILSTNMGSRLGFLVAVAGLSGWMMLMGFVWALYGIGYKGTAPHWKVEEVVTSQTADDLDASHLEPVRDLSKWKELAADNPARGEAQATASAALTGEESRVKSFEAESEFKVIDAFTYGGKDVSKNVKWSKPFGDKGFVGWLKGWVPGPHPPHYTIIQVQAVEKVDVPFGEAPPKPVVDESAPVQSVVLVRDLGKLRVPAVLITLSSMIVFAITCNVLHRRDKVLMANRAAAAAAA